MPPDDDNAVAKAKTKHGVEVRLAQEADALYEEAMRQSYQEAEAFEPHIGRAAEELDESWQQLMCTLSMDEQRNQQSGPKKKTIRMPSAPSSGRTPRSARRMGMSSAPATKPAAGSAPARPTSESARMYATFDAHTELWLVPSAPPHGDADCVSGGPASCAAAASCSASGGVRTRPRAALEALDALRASPRARGPSKAVGSASAHGGAVGVALALGVRTVVQGHCGRNERAAPPTQGLTGGREPVWAGVLEPRAPRQPTAQVAIRISSCTRVQHSAQPATAGAGSAGAAVVVGSAAASAAASAAVSAAASAASAAAVSAAPTAAPPSLRPSISAQAASVAAASAARIAPEPPLQPIAPTASSRASLRPFVSLDQRPPSDVGDKVSAGALPATAEGEASPSAASAKVLEAAAYACWMQHRHLPPSLQPPLELEVLLADAERSLQRSRSSRGARHGAGTPGPRPGGHGAHHGAHHGAFDAPPLAAVAAQALAPSSARDALRAAQLPPGPPRQPSAAERAWGVRRPAPPSVVLLLDQQRAAAAAAHASTPRPSGGGALAFARLPLPLEAPPMEPHKEPPVAQHVLPSMTSTTRPATATVGSHPAGAAGASAVEFSPRRRSKWAL